MFVREFELSNLKLTLKLPDCGLYVFGPDSGTGKTYLCKLLEKMDLNKIKVVTYVKNKKLQDEMIKLAINADIVFFDRFDLYATEELISSLVELSKSKLIVLDYKHKSSSVMKVYKILNVTLTDKEMRVY